MTIPPLCIIQARLDSSRLANKMLLCVGGKPLLRWTWDAAVERFGADNVAVACPASDAPAFREVVPHRVFGSYVASSDVLGRLYEVASALRSHDDLTAVIHRVTPDDFLPQLDRDVTTLGQLREWHITRRDPFYREHVGYLFHWNERPAEINTIHDYEQALRWYSAQR